VQKFPSLSKVTFPRASTSIVDDRPKADVTLLAATALLVAKDTVHPAIVYLLLEAAREVHSREDYFAPIGTFPNLNTQEFPISNESTRYFQSGRPFLHRYLPFAGGVGAGFAASRRSASEAAARGYVSRAQVSGGRAVERRATYP